MALQIICKNCSNVNDIIDLNQKLCRKCSTPFPDEVSATIATHLVRSRPFLLQLGMYMSMAFSILMSFILFNSTIGCGNFKVNEQVVQAIEFNRVFINFIPSILVSFLIWYCIKTNEPMTRLLCILFWPLYMFGFAMISFQLDQNWSNVILGLIANMIIPVLSTIGYFYYKPNVVKYYEILKKINERPHVG